MSLLEGQTLSVLSPVSFFMAPFGQCHTYVPVLQLHVNATYVQCTATA